MGRRERGKTVSFDVMVKFFLKQYGIPTRKDIERILNRIDRLEKVVRYNRGYGRATVDAGTKEEKSKPATEIVLSIIRRYRSGIGFAELQKQTDLEEKKLRNIIYRLDKNGWIRRVRRGVYTATKP